ncbi:cell division protein ZapE, partial [Francisella tularensis subsp. holarctica]|nr:cell division protein ZapE [Francisella tularensis subsp. holarctica]
YPYNEHNLKNFFDKFFLRNSQFDKDLSIRVLARDIPTILLSHKDVCFDFKVICGDGRSAHDDMDMCPQDEPLFIWSVG